METSLMQKIQMVDLKGQYEYIKEPIDAAIRDVISATAFINGEPVKQFANELADYLNAKHIIPCGNGTDALQIALMALELKPGDEVITTPFTFIATAEVIYLLGLKPVFVDIDPHTFTIAVDQIEKVITNKTKCILPVHLFGQCADMEQILQIAHANKLFVVEDNAQAIGADYTFNNGKQQKGGSIGDIGTTSFYPSKNLGCYGDGGAISTNNEELATRIQTIANHGTKMKYNAEIVGVNSRLDTIQAAILRIKLQHLDEYISKRQKAAAFYDNAFKDSNIKSPARSDNSTHVFHQYTILVENDRDVLQKHLAEKDIPSAIFYPIPLHLQSAFEQFGYKKGNMPVAEKLAQEVLSLPMHTELAEEQLDFISKSVIGFNN